MYKNILVNVKYGVCIIIGIILLISFSFWLIISTEEKLYGKEIEIKDEQINLSKYYASFDMTVISNKNINTYVVKEWYEKDGKCTLEFLDSMKNNVVIINENGVCTITNMDNAANILASNVGLVDNISSFSTFIKLYNNINGKCDCTKTAHSKNGETKITINIDGLCKCTCCNSINSKDISKLEVVIKENIPVTYIVYDKNKNEHISIVYNTFEI